MQINHSEYLVLQQTTCTDNIEYVKKIECVKNQSPRVGCLIFLAKESIQFTGSFNSFRSSHFAVFLGKGVLKICSKFTGEQPSRSTLLKSHFSMGAPVNLMHIFRTCFLKNTSGWLLLQLLQACREAITLHLNHKHQKYLCIRV